MKKIILTAAVCLGGYVSSQGQVTGSVLAETVFSWPGIGRLVYESITRRDIPMVTGSIILCSILMCLINLVVDLVYAFFDPRIKAQYSKKG